MIALVSVLVAAGILVGEGLSIQRLFDVEDVRRAAAANKIENECVLGEVPFYVLNLDKRRADKLVNMERAMGRDAPWMCKRTCRVSAPDGQEWGSHVNRRIVDEKVWQKARNVSQYEKVVGVKLTPGAVALIAGHGRMWEHILQEKAPFAVVMEDDLFRFHPDFKRFLCWITQIRGLQDGWDFMMAQMANIWVNAAHQLTFTKGEWVANTGMYIIKLDAARKALKTMFPISKPTQLDMHDSPFWTKLRGAHTVPAVADASHEITDVQQYLVQNTTASASSDCSIPDCKPLDTSHMVVPALASPTEG